jgi:site-specific DNA recombinase
MGYKAERGHKALILDEEKATTVRRVFELRDTKPEASLQKIADILNADGFTTKEDKPFHPMQVKRILDRKAFYEGTYRYSGVEVDGQHQTILLNVSK